MRMFAALFLHAINRECTSDQLLSEFNRSTIKQRCFLSPCLAGASFAVPFRVWPCMMTTLNSEKGEVFFD